MRFLMFGISPVYGGTEAVIYSMLDEFHKNGLDFDYIRATDKPLAKEDWLISMGSSVYHINLRKRGRFLEYRKGIDSFFGEHAGKYDGVWINLQEPEGSYILKSAARHGIKERILVAHSSDYCSDSGFLRRISIDLSRKPLLKYATKCIAVSKLASEFTYGGKGDNKITIIRSGIDTERNAYNESSRRAIRDKFSVGNDDVVLASIGRLTTQKNFAFSIDILSEYKKKHPTAKLLIVGDGETRQSLINRTKEKDVSDSVVFVGVVEDTSPYFSAADYFLFPSTAEGLGMVLIEAQCSGLPCFASDGPIPKEAKVTDLVTWLPLSSESAAWAKTIHETPPRLNRKSYRQYFFDSGLDNWAVAHQYLKLLGF